MPYKVFLSHSTRDQGLVASLANLFAKFGATVFVAEWYLAPGQDLGRKVFDEIDSCDCVVALLTRDGARSNWVQQELGCAMGKQKPIVPLVERGTSHDNLAALSGKEYIEYDPRHPHEALTRTMTYVLSLKLGKEKQKKTLLIAGSITALLLLLSGAGR